MSADLPPLPTLWQGRERFVVLQAGFGRGDGFLSAWADWQADARRCGRLHFIAVEAQPLSHEALRETLRGTAWPDLAARLAEAWPPLTRNLHRLAFDGGRVHLLLAPGPLDTWLPELLAQVDAFVLGGHPFRPGDTRTLKALARLAAPAAVLSADSVDGELRHGLRTAGFEPVPCASGTVARYAPAFTPRRSPSRQASAAGAGRHALILGAGLAGCASAWALSEQGWSSTLVDRQAAPALETSGNPAGLFHGIVNPQDGAHARFNRAAALEARRAVAQALREAGIAGEVDGLLRLETALPDAAAMRQLLERLGLPPDYVRAVDAAEASALCGLPLSLPAWFYPGGGWVQPAGLARAYLQRAGEATRFRGGLAVASIRREQERWQLLSAGGELIDESEVLVLANAGEASGLLPTPAWPQQSVRGQISLLPADGRIALPRLPLAGAGYLLPEVGAQVIFGASAQPGDTDPAVREADHRHNLAQLARLTGSPLEPAPAMLSGRTGWRCVTDDRLPIIGAVPDIPAAHASARPLDQPRRVPRLPGLFVMTALGSRGITWSALGAQALAATITGAPLPLEAGLLDAIDPARFFARSVRRSA